VMFARGTFCCCAVVHTDMCHAATHKIYAFWSGAGPHPAWRRTRRSKRTPAAGKSNGQTFLRTEAPCTPPSEDPEGRGQRKHQEEDAADDEDAALADVLGEHAATQHRSTGGDEVAGDRAEADA